MTVNLNAPAADEAAAAMRKSLIEAGSDRESIVRQIGEATVDNDQEAIELLEPALAAIDRKIERLEAGLQAQRRRNVSAEYAAARAEVEAARQGVVDAAAKAKALEPKISKAAAEFVKHLIEFRSTLDSAGDTAVRALRRNKGSRAIATPGFGLMPRSTVDAVLANVLFQLGRAEGKASGFVPDVGALVNQQLQRLLANLDSDASYLPAFKAVAAKDQADEQAA